MALFGSAVTTAAQAVPTVTIAPVAGLGGDDVLAAAKALTPLGDVVVPGMVRPFQDHQAAAYEACLGSIARWGGVMLGDDMGLGKTQVMLALVAQRLADRGGYAIMVAPPVAQAGYRGDLATAFPHLRFHHLYGRKADFVNMPSADIYFVNDDAQTMKAWTCNETTEHVRGRDVKVLHGNWFAAGASIITRDEIHRDKGNQAKPTGRAKVMLALGDLARAQGIWMVGATGTLLTNRPVEAFLPLTIVGGDALVKALTPGANKASSFLFRYCSPSTSAFGTDFGGYDEDQCSLLHEYLCRTAYVRREKRDVPGLPHGGWMVKPLALPDNAMRTYDRVVRDFLAWYEESRGKGAADRAKRAETIVRMQNLWAQAGAAKADAAIDYAMDLVDQGHKVVLFYYHQDVWTALATGLARQGVESVSINGMVTGAARDHAIADFQAEGGPMVMLAQIKAAGMAVTLTRAAHAVFVQVPWSAGDLKQAADRILRVDQISRDRAEAGEGITWHVLQASYFDGGATFDMSMWGVLETKAKVCDMVNAGKAVTMDDESVHMLALEAWLPTAKSRWR